MNKRRTTEYIERPKGSNTINVLLMLYMVSVPLFTYYATLNLLSQGIFILAFGGIAALLLFENKKWKMDTAILFFLGFMAFCIFSFLWTKDFNSTATKIISFVQLLVLYVLLYSYISNYDCIDALLIALFISGLILAIVVISFYGITEYIRLMLKGHRLGGVINNVNVIGLYMAATVIIGFYYGYFKGKSWIYIVDVIPLFVGFGTGSRKCLVMMVMGVGIIIFMQYKEKVSLKSFGKLLLALIVAIALIWWLTTLPVFQGAFNRILAMLGSENQMADQTTIIRGQMVQLGWENFLNRPFTGIGIGCSWILTEEAFGWSTYLHNNFIELLATTGVFGFLLWYAIYAYLILNLYKLSVKDKNPEAVLMMTMLLCTFFMGWGAVSYIEKTTYIYFAIASGVLIVGRKKEKEERASERHLQEVKEGVDKSQAPGGLYN